jgi:hypothetical protein
LASLILHKGTRPSTRGLIVAILLLLILSLALVTIYSGGLRSREAHARVPAALAAAPRPPPESVLSHPLHFRSILSVFWTESDMDVDAGGNLIRLYEVDSVNSGDLTGDELPDVGSRQPLLNGALLSVTLAAS